MNLIRRFKKKPDEIEAFRVLLEHCRGEKEIPFKEVNRKEGYTFLEISSKEETIKAYIGEWVIKNLDGEISVISEEYLQKRYCLID